MSASAGGAPVTNGSSPPRGKRRHYPYTMLTCQDYRDFLGGLDAGSVDLVLTDPPYGISKEHNRKHGFKGRQDNLRMHFGEWDTSQIDLNEFATGVTRALRAGGTLIVWYSNWAMSHLHDAVLAAGLGMPRLIVWNKPSPMPAHPGVTYLAGARELALCVNKGGKPTFNSHYDTGEYTFTVPRGKARSHPTQKPLGLFTELVEKHSNPDDLVVDPFLGSGTTAMAAINTGRRFTGCDISPDYVAAAQARVKEAQGPMDLPLAA